MYLGEQKADALHQAPVLADDYSLTHKNTFLRSESQASSMVTSEGNSKREENRQLPLAPRLRNDAQGRGRPDNSQRAVGVSVCYYCKRKGHVMAECRVLEKKKAVRMSLLSSKTNV